MKTFYTVDRARTLSPGQVLSPFRNGVSEEPFRTFLDDLFPNGISRHGQQYLENPNCAFSSREGALELYFEEVRKRCYQELPSRFESIFCCESADEAIEMRGMLHNPGVPIFEVKVDGSIHRANMSLLNNVGSILSLSHRAHEYWQGVEGGVDQGPVWEIIAKLPVEVGQRIR
ncbi:DUF2441 domain-containing protein [Halomonas sp. OfavH-34-E]|uniref:DUF2441 domain-containing protein n=1 Tax=Halomonas sp. OfavH-34-E TaxID=2954491 RepID=UPI002097AE8A|nr:DUF2441 domain-containing protein [Halomonas sp. OfavH-34-E]